MKPLLYLSLSLNAAAVLIACGTGDMPRWDGKWWAADSANGAIVRAQEGRQIRCTDPEFQDYACLTYHDLGCLGQQLIYNCEKWRNPNPRCEAVTEQVIKAAAGMR